VIKTHSLNLSASPFLVATVDPASLTNNFVVPARTLRDWLDHFAASGSTTAKAGTEATGNVNRQESELGWYFHPEQVRVRTWESGSAARRAISTELKIGVTEFDEYEISEIVCLTFPLREFRVSADLVAHIYNRTYQR
jgi:cell cycle checkpoint control protein RAD9A